jgi:hypothetical protein
MRQHVSGVEMAKPLDKEDAFSQEKYRRLDGYQEVENRFKREDKRVWKKDRTKHLRNKARKETRERLDELEP